MQTVDSGAARSSRWPLSFAAIGVLILSGCVPPLVPAGPGDPQPPAPIDFSRALQLGNMAFDVTANKAVSNATLRQRYGSATVDALVFSTVLPGDDGVSRFMILTDNRARRHTLVLAGTNTQIQWAVDAATALIFQDDVNGNVHVGWHTLSFGVFNNLLPDLRSDYPITVTGFSLGAAVSCIVSEYLIFAGYTVDEVVTFGQPRITDSTGIPTFGTLPITRFVNDGDPFPNMKASGSPAVHFGPMVVLYDGGFYAYVPANDPAQEVGTRPFEDFADNEFGFHAEDLYRQRLSAKLAAPTQVVYVP